MKFVSASLRYWRKAVSLALVLWCAGTGCLLVNYAHAAEAMTQPHETIATSRLATISTTTAAGSLDPHSCCHAHQTKHERKSALASTPATAKGNVETFSLSEAPEPASAMSCCPLTSGSFLATARAQVNTDTSATPANPVASQSIASQFSTTQVSNSQYLPNQAQTHLHCCVFLI